MTLQNFKDTIAKGLYKLTVREAHADEICIQCREPALSKCYSDAGIREYTISGLCEQCFDGIFGGGSD